MMKDNVPPSGGFGNLTLVEHEGEPRVRDVVLGKSLGLARPTNIRALIERHMDTLRRFGEVCTTVVQTSGKGGRAGGIEYRLNEEQAVFIVTQSDAPNSADAKVAVVKVFVAWRHGRLVPADPPSTREIGGVVRGVVAKHDREVMLPVVEQMLYEMMDRMMAAVPVVVEDTVRRLIGERLPSMVEDRLARDTRRAVLEYRKAVEVANDLGIPVKGRRGTVTTISKKLAAISDAWDLVPHTCPVDGARMFSVDVVEYWKRKHGAAFVAGYIARKTGQLALALDKPKRRRKAAAQQETQEASHLKALSEIAEDRAKRIAAEVASLELEMRADALKMHEGRMIRDALKDGIRKTEAVAFAGAVMTRVYEILGKAA